jgi:hypothetical protein
LTDRGDGAVRLLDENIQRNSKAFTATTSNSQVQVNAAPLTWGDNLSNEQFHLIIGSDLLYNTQDSYEPLLRTIKHHLHRDGRIILAVRWRKPDLECDFFKMAAALRLKFVLWTEVMNTLDFPSRCPCRLDWKEYGDSTSEAFTRFFCETKMTVSNNKIGNKAIKSLTEITESDLEDMSESEYTAFEESQIQIYVGCLANEEAGSGAAKKRSLDDISLY